MALPTNRSPSSTSRLSPFHKVSASDLGISAAAGNTTPNSNWIPCAGYNQCTLIVKYTKDGGHTPTNIDFGIDVSDDESTAYPLQTSSVSSGTATLSTLKYRKACGGASINYSVELPLNYEFFRVNALTVTGGVAGDDMTVTCFLGNV